MKNLFRKIIDELNNNTTTSYSESNDKTNENVEETIDIEITGECKVLVEKEVRNGYHTIYDRNVIVRYELNIEFMNHTIKHVGKKYVYGDGHELVETYSNGRLISYNRGYTDEDVYEYAINLINNNDEKRAYLMDEIKRDVLNNVKNYCHNIHLEKMKGQLEKNNTIEINMKLTINESDLD